MAIDLQVREQMFQHGAVVGLVSAHEHHWGVSDRWASQTPPGGWWFHQIEVRARICANCSAGSRSVRRSGLVNQTRLEDQGPSRQLLCCA